MRFLALTAIIAPLLSSCQSSINGAVSSARTGTLVSAAADNLVFTSVTPSQCKPGDVVSLTGEGFLPGMVAWLGDVQVATTYINAESATATVPLNMPLGAIDASISLVNNSTSRSNTVALTIAPVSGTIATLPSDAPSSSQTSTTLNPSGQGSLVTTSTLAVIDAPNFVSLALINDAADGYLNALESTQSHDLVGALVADHYDTVSYKIVDVATNCATAAGYAPTVPQNNAAAFVADGSYKVCVELTNAGSGKTYGASAVIIRDTTAPIVDAGPDRNGSFSFTQVATATDAHTMTYAWTQVSGPGTLTFGSATALTTTISANALGAYVIRLTATDAAGNSAYDELTSTWSAPDPSVCQRLWVALDQS